MQSYELAPWQHEHFEGHLNIDEHFKTIIEQHKLHHAYLLHGPKGVGKRTFAFRLARYLFALNHKKHAEPSLFGDALSEPLEGLEADLPAGVKSQVEMLIYPDLLYVSTENPKFESTSKTGAVTVKMVREVSKFLQLSSSQGGWRVIIFDQFDRLTNSAQNAILKILEEPPEKVVLLLLTSAPGYILQTIKSRCQKVFFPSLTSDNLTALLNHHFEDATEYNTKIKTHAHYMQGSFGNLVKLIAHDGFDIITNFTAQLDDFNYNQMSDYLDKIKVNQNPYHYEMTLQILEHWMSHKIKSGENPEHWFASYEQYMTQVRDYEKLHLDKKMTLLSFLSAL